MKCAYCGRTEKPRKGIWRSLPSKVKGYVDTWCGLCVPPDMATPKQKAAPPKPVDAAPERRMPNFDEWKRASQAAK